jgi:hypothetical protein
MAAAVAPYLHPRLSSTKVCGSAGSALEAIVSQIASRKKGAIT